MLYSFPDSGFKSRGVSIASETLVYSITVGTINSIWGHIGLLFINL